MDKPDFSKPVLLSVEHLQLYCDPFRAICWSDLAKPLTKLEVGSAMIGRMSKANKARYDHAVNIAYFVNNWNSSDYICVDVGAPVIGFRPSWIITDGNHRFAAALYRGDDSILAECSGQHSVLEKLLFNRKSQESLA